MESCCESSMPKTSKLKTNRKRSFKDVKPSKNVEDKRRQVPNRVKKFNRRDSESTLSRSTRQKASDKLRGFTGQKTQRKRGNRQRTQRF